MSSLSSFLILLVTMFSFQHTSAECDVPGSFLPYGDAAGDTTIADALYETNISAPLHVFGGNETFYRLTIGQASPAYMFGMNSGILVAHDPSHRFSSEQQYYYRYSTESTDLSAVNALTCGPFDSILIMTFPCAVISAANIPFSYQWMLASGPGKTVFIVNYQPANMSFPRVIVDLGASRQFLMRNDDIADDGLTILDVTRPPMPDYRDWLLIHDSGPCTECITPDSFLPYGFHAGDEQASHINLYDDDDDVSYSYTATLSIFGTSADEYELLIYADGSLDLWTAENKGIRLLPMDIGNFLTGNVFYRHSTDSADLSMVNAMACGPFDGVFVVTYACVGSYTPYSYQVLVAYGSGKTILIVDYGTSSGFGPGEIQVEDVYTRYTLNDADIADDGLTIIDITNTPTQNENETLPVLPGGPCLETKTCEVYADGSVKMLNGSTVFNELTMAKSFLATVDKAARKKNDDPCKFSLMIQANDLKQPAYNIRIAVGLHPKNTKKYLRKFDISLTNDTFVKEFGYNLATNTLIYQADLPYVMEDTDSAEPLGITIDLTDANDGWIIKSATCGYSFTHLWNNQNPIVAMTLIGDRYDDRIMATCGGVLAYIVPNGI